MISSLRKSSTLEWLDLERNKRGDSSEGTVLFLRLLSLVSALIRVLSSLSGEVLPVKMIVVVEESTLSLCVFGAKALCQSNLRDLVVSSLLYVVEMSVTAAIAEAVEFLVEVVAALREKLLRIRQR